MNPYGSPHLSRCKQQQQSLGDVGDELEVSQHVEEVAMARIDSMSDDDEDYVFEETDEDDPLDALEDRFVHPPKRPTQSKFRLPTVVRIYG